MHTLATLSVPKGGSNNYSQGSAGPTVGGTAQPPQSQVRFPASGTFRLTDKGFGTYSATFNGHSESTSSACYSSQDWYPTLTTTIGPPLITSIDHPSAAVGQTLSTINVTGNWFTLDDNTQVVTAASIVTSDLTTPVPGVSVGSFTVLNKTTVQLNNVQIAASTTPGSYKLVLTALGLQVSADFAVQGPPTITTPPASTIYIGAGGQASITVGGTPSDSAKYTWEVLAPQSGDDTTILGTTSTLPACLGQSTCTATLVGDHSGSATLRLHFASTATGQEATADARLIVVKIDSVTVTVKAHVGTDQINAFPITLPAGPLHWGDDLWSGASASPMILVRGSLDSISLQAFQNPLTVDPGILGAVGFDIQQDPDEAKCRGAATPTIGPTFVGGGYVKLDQTGSFQILVFVDSNGNGKWDVGEVGMALPLVLVQAGLTANLSTSPNPSATYVRVGPAWSLSEIDAGARVVCNASTDIAISYCALLLSGQVDLVGGACDGLRGVDRIAGGWSQTANAPNVVGSYYTPPAPANTPPSAITPEHFDTWVFASNKNTTKDPYHQYFGPNVPADPAVLSGPLLDTSNPSPGSGSDSSLMGNGWYQSASTQPMLGNRTVFSAFDVPFGQVPAQNYGYPQTFLFEFQYNLSFTSYLVLWSNLAPNTYAVTLEQPWSIQSTFYTDGSGNPTDGQGNPMPTISQAVTVDTSLATPHSNPAVPATGTKIVLIIPTANNATADNMRK